MRKSLSRRDFLKGAAAGMCGVTINGLLHGQAEEVSEVKAASEAEEVSETKEASETNEASETKKASDINEESETKEVSEAKGDIVLTVPILFDNEIPEDIDRICEAASVLTEEKIGVGMNLVPIVYNNTSNSTNSRENWELTLLEKQGIVFDVRPSTLPEVSCIPLNDLLEEYGQDILALISDERLAFEEEDGILYHLPSVSDYVSSFGITMRKDLVEKCGIELPEKYSLDALDKLFTQIHEKYPDMYMVSGYWTVGGFIGRMKNAEMDVSVFRVETVDDEIQCINYYATDEYERFVSLLYRWRQKGYISRSLVLQNQPASQLVKAGVVFAYFSACKPSIAYEESIRCGQEMVTVSLMDAVVSAYSLSASVHWGISERCEHPEEAMRLLNLLYSDAELINLLVYGIEGLHYEFAENGTIRYPESIEESTVAYNNSQPWVLPNQLLTYIWEGADAQIWEKTEEYNYSVPWKESVFFSFDTAGCEMELAAIQDVLEKYSAGLESGQLNPEIYLPEMLGEMEAAGVETVRREIERQYRIWKESRI